MLKRSTEEMDGTGKTTGKKQSFTPATLHDVLSAMATLDIPGTSSLSGNGSIMLPYLPGLQIDSLGLVPLPLTTAEWSRKIISVATKAPFGKGPDTIVDDKVRKSWQVDAAKISFTNPNWDTSIQQLASDVATSGGLGLPDNVEVRAIPYKLLFYEQGCFFKKHRDSEKEDGMFATLVVQLPSIYTGGTLVVSHGKNDTKEYHMGTDDGTAPFSCHYVAHYADIEHEIKPITSGYRLALVYSLCYQTDTPNPTPSLESASLSTKTIHSVLDRLPEKKKMMFVPLTHQYTMKCLTRYGLKGLKGTDIKIMRTLQMHSKNWIFRVFKIQREVIEYVGDMDDVDFIDEGHCAKEKDLHRKILEFNFDKGSAVFEEVYWPEGINKRVSDSCFSDLKVFVSCMEGGSVLATPEEVGDTWKMVYSEPEEYTGNDGYESIKTKYESFVLLAYMPIGENHYCAENNILLSEH